METLETILDEIRAAPDDDSPRQVYADALERAGDPERAELIRLQVADARGQADAAMVRRAKALCGKRELLGVIGEHAYRWKYDRGLVVEIDVHCRKLAEHGTAMFAIAPIRSLTIRDARDGDIDDELDFEAVADQLAQQPWLRGVSAVEIPLYTEFADHASRLLASPYLRGLSTLKVGSPRTAIDAAERCALPSLRRLYVHAEGASEGDEVLAAFATRRDKLTRLEVIGCECGPAAAAAIARAGWSLEGLVFAGTHYVEDHIGALGIRALAQAPSLATLESLEIETAGLDDDALHALAASPYLRPIRRLSLGGNIAITDGGLAALAASAVLERASELDLTATSTTARGIAMVPNHVKVIAPHIPKQERRT